MLGQYLTGRIDNLSRRGQLRPTLTNQLGMVAARNEANLHAIRLVKYRKTRLTRQFPDFVLPIAAYGKQQVRQQTLPQSEQDVGLVLVGIGGSMKLRAILAGHQTRIMTGGYEIRSELLPI